MSRSSVMVEDEVSTREDRVDMEAESTRMMTMAISTSGRLDSMAGTMESYTMAPLALYWMAGSPANSRPKPPRK